MNTTARLAAFGAGLVAVLGVGAGLGEVVGPDTTTATAEPPAPVGEGVVVTADGYRLVPETVSLSPAGGPFRFVITGPDGRPQHAFTPVHERDLHLIVVNRELVSYHHVHPTLAADGEWSVDLPALTAGSYRAVADFQVAGGPRLALGTDVSVAGAYIPGTLASPSTRAAVDGYDVRLATVRGRGGEVQAALTVRRNGQVVTDLQPYLGASGHLVAMRSGDLAYAHVHPVTTGHGDAAAGIVRFDATLTAAGRYALFFDFKHAGTVHTAAFTFDQGVVTGAAPMEH
jgi:hypothetical protein